MTSPLRRRLGVASAPLVLCLASCSVLDTTPPVPDDWTPRGSVPMVVAFAPGGGSDRSARVIAQGLNELEAGFDVNVENKEGGSGAVGWATFLAEQGNGNTLLVAETALNTLPLVYDVPFTYRDFTPLVMFAEDSRVVVAPADSEFTDCHDVIEASENERVVVGSSGRTGADSLVVAELTEEGGSFDTVPYGSSGEVMTGLLGGQVDFAPTSAASVKPYLESGDLVPLCSMTAERYDDPVLGEVPTAREQGIDAQVTVWRGVFAAGGIADVQRDYWIAEIERAMESDTYRDYLADDLLIPADRSGDEFAAYLETYDERMREVYQ
ncbi:tripartite tricarboxylate transporter substrate binding protein [Streptomyces hainanensis]|uniref:Tripartite tricarboxylate transporter substrate binding protein n=1 Tax=Streptomyces hainanensis TaxID=402648 RepID=A0A4R4SMC6_9ACTN|nr:tripartite tricarboxylate transporter substrate binding protein [Streptomyces hainanensis]TDC63252.1 tripartite tricarboxylate transporter substrate binding protein [Streptomyces hainanensis]